jgi:hypothetical protein
VTLQLREVRTAWETNLCLHKAAQTAATGDTGLVIDLELSTHDAGLLHAELADPELPIRTSCQESIQAEETAQQHMRPHTGKRGPTAMQPPAPRLPKVLDSHSCSWQHDSARATVVSEFHAFSLRQGAAGKRSLQDPIEDGDVYPKQQKIRSRMAAAKAKVHRARLDMKPLHPSKPCNGADTSVSDHVKPSSEGTPPHIQAPHMQAAFYTVHSRYCAGAGVVMRQNLDLINKHAMTDMEVQREHRNRKHMAAGHRDDPSTAPGALVQHCPAQKPLHRYFLSPPEISWKKPKCHQAINMKNDEQPVVPRTQPREQSLRVQCRKENVTASAAKVDTRTHIQPLSAQLTPSPERPRYHLTAEPISTSPAEHLRLEEAPLAEKADAVPANVSERKNKSQVLSPYNPPQVICTILT